MSLYKDVENNAIMYFCQVVSVYKLFLVCMVVKCSIIALPTGLDPSKTSAKFRFGELGNELIYFLACKHATTYHTVMRNNIDKRHKT